MKLEKAIEIADIIVKEPYNFYTEDNKTALKLLIEAGNRIIAYRHLNAAMEPMELPGETF